MNEDGVLVAPSLDEFTQSLNKISFPQSTIKIISRYQSDPLLLDHVLPNLIDMLLPINLDTSQAIHCCAATRSYKLISRLLPSGPPSLLKTALLKLQEDTTWQERYCWLLQLGNVVLLPFEMKKLGVDPKDLLDQLKEYLPDPGPVREVSAWLLGKILQRQDIKNDKLVHTTLQWASSPEFLSQGVFSQCGALRMFSEVLSQEDASDIVSHASKIRLAVTVADGNNPLIRKLKVKISSRLALVELAHLQNIISFEDTIGVLFDALSDGDTAVRYTSAKWLARLSSRLDPMMQQQIISEIFGLYAQRSGKLSTKSVSDATWHGATLVLAELYRRKVSVPLEDVIRTLSRCLFFDQRRLRRSIGAHVRDAACFLAWSMFRSVYLDDREMQQMTEYLVCAASYDREVNVRRAASAALQEGIGRHGLDHGIFLVQELDWLAVGQRRRAFLDAAPLVASICFRKALESRCLEVAFKHWDAEMRRLASQSAGLLMISVACLCQYVRPTNLAGLHGYWLALGACLRNKDDAIKALKTLDANIDMFSDHEADLPCEAACSLISCAKNFTGSSEHARRIVDLSLERDSEVVLVQALAATSPNHAQISVWQSRLKANKRNFALALAKNGEGAFDLLAAYHSSDVEMRQFVTRGLGWLLRSLQDQNKQTFADGAFSALLDSLDDYTIDVRGDVGSWVRQEAIEAWQVLYVEAMESTKFYWPLLQRKLVRIALEKLGKLRHLACHLLVLVTSEMPGTTFSWVKTENVWLHDEEYYAKMMQCFEVQEWREEIWKGLVTSAAGGSESNVRLPQNV